MKLFKLILAVASAAVLVAALVSTASANRLSSSSQTLRARFPNVSFLGGFGNTECALTLEGSFHTRTIVKTSGALIGYLTRAIIGGTHCIRGSATILTTSLPWHIRYESFGGTLPNITAINTTLTGVQLQVKEPVFGIVCLASGGTLTDRYIRDAGGVLTTEVLGGTSPTSCGSNGTLSGTSESLTVLNSVTRITVTLI
jgi:hypothetical protein